MEVLCVRLVGHPSCPALGCDCSGPEGGSGEPPPGCWASTLSSAVLLDSASLGTEGTSVGELEDGRGIRPPLSWSMILEMDGVGEECCLAVGVEEVGAPF